MAQGRRPTETLVVLTPIAPARTGNGLAMRVGHHVRVAQRDRDVVVGVVPIAGRVGGDGSPGVEVVEVPLGEADVRRGIGRLLEGDRWPARLAQVDPLPRRARVASPGLVDAVLSVLPERAWGAAVHVVRAYLAPLGLAVAEALGAPRVTLDLDDDDSATADARGDGEEARAYDRLVTTFGPAFDGLSVASPDDARALAARTGMQPVAVPNAVDVPAVVERDPAIPPVLLYLGNLTYGPNIDGATALVREVLPRVQAAGVTATVALVGPHDPGGPIHELRGVDGVQVVGAVPEVEPWYRRSTCAVVPLAAGTGTRIKLLEAFAHQLPVVCTPMAAAGLGVRTGVDALLGTSPDELAAHVVTILEQPAIATQLAAEATEVARRHASGAVAPAVRAFLFGTGAG